jgi:D-sedoheptulose 7-phosphate isomerase
MQFEGLVRQRLEESISLKQKISEGLISQIEWVARRIIDALCQGNKLILFGNGGSASDAQHIAAEFVGRFRRDRQALSAITLGMNVSTLTAVANDFGYANIFSRELVGLAKAGDVAIGISTSGTSLNVIRGLDIAEDLDCFTVALTGCLKESARDGPFVCANEVLEVPSQVTARVQEMHIFIGHMLAEMVEGGMA